MGIDDIKHSNNKNTECKIEAPKASKNFGRSRTFWRSRKLSRTTASEHGRLSNSSPHSFCLCVSEINNLAINKLSNIFLLPLRSCSLDNFQLFFLLLSLPSCCAVEVQICCCCELFCLAQCEAEREKFEIFMSFKQSFPPSLFSTTTRVPPFGSVFPFSAPNACSSKC